MTYLRREVERARQLTGQFPEKFRTAGTSEPAFDRLYQPIRVVARGTAVDRALSADPLLQGPWLDRCEARHAFVLGAAGAGKSWWLRREDAAIARRALHLIKECEAGIDEVVVPVRVDCAELATAVGNRPLESLLGDHVYRLITAALTATSAGTASGLSSTVDWLAGRLEAGAVVLLVDGWDRVPADHDRIAAAILRFVDRYPRVRLVLTSRQSGYARAPLFIPGGDVFSLAGLDDAAIEALCHVWCGSGDDTLRRALSANATLRDLARNPRMLALMCQSAEGRELLEAGRVDAPFSRARTLKHCLTGFLRAGAAGGGPSEDEGTSSSAEFAGLLAYRLFDEPSPYSWDRVGAVIDALQSTLPAPHLFSPRRMSRQEVLVRLSTANILVPNAADRESQAVFLHDGVREYLAAAGLALPAVSALAGGANVAEAAAMFAKALLHRTHDPAWHDVLVLAVDYVATAQQATRPAEGPSLAGAAIEVLLGDAGIRREQLVPVVASLAAELRPVPLPESTIAALRLALAGAMRDDGFTPAIRVAAGTALGRLGDVRFNARAWYLPDDDQLGFVRIPGGAFLMGSGGDDSASDNDEPLQRAVLPEFWIARWPVTVAQYGRFIESAGTRDGASSALQAAPNHPVANISWRDAMAYCLWLTRELQRTAAADRDGGEMLPRALVDVVNAGWVVLPPSEAEWEKAARGTDARVWPWTGQRDRFDQAAANCWDDRATAIGATSAVGCFAGGASPYGVEDMSGNVWEWTRSAYLDRGFEHPDDDWIRTIAPRTIRGGSFRSDRRGIRAAARDRLEPDLRGSDVGCRLALIPPYLAPADWTPRGAQSRRSM